MCHHHHSRPMAMVLRIQPMVATMTLSIGAWLLGINGRVILFSQELSMNIGPHEIGTLIYGRAPHGYSQREDTM